MYSIRSAVHIIVISLLVTVTCYSLLVTATLVLESTSNDVTSTKDLVLGAG